jgi:cytoskeletal protein RodZ
MRVFESIKISNGNGQRVVESVYQIPNEWIDQISKEMCRVAQEDTKNLVVVKNQLERCVSFSGGAMTLLWVVVLMLASLVCSVPIP